MANQNLEYFLNLNIKDFLTHLTTAKKNFDGDSRAMATSAKVARRKINSAFKTLEMKPFRDIQKDIAITKAAYSRLAKSGKLSGKELAIASEKARVKVASLRREMTMSTGTTSGLKTSVVGLVKAYAGFMAVQAVTRVVVQASNTFADFDDKIREVGAVSNATAEELDRLRARAKEMGETTRYTATQSAEGLKYLSMAGFDVNEQIAALPGVLQLAMAGAMELGDAADITTNILTGYGKEVGELSDVNDKLVATFTNSNTSLMELGYAFSYAGPIAKATGQEFAETATMLGIFANAGFKGERGGTALRGAISKLLKPTTAARQAMDELGFSAKDSTGKLKPMTQVVQELKEKGASATQMLDLFGLRAGPAMTAAIGISTETVKKLKEQIIESGGSAKRVADEMEAGLGGTKRKLVAAWEAVEIAIGEALEQENIDLVQSLTDSLLDNKDAIIAVAQDAYALMSMVYRVTKSISEFVIKNRLLIETLITVGVTVWGVQKAFLVLRAVSLLSWATTIITTIGGLSAGMISATVATMGLWTALGALAVIGVATVAIATCAKALYDLYQVEQDSVQATKDLAEQQKEIPPRLEKISKSTGLTISTLQQFKDLVKSQTIVFDKATGTWVKASIVIGKVGSSHASAATDILASKEALDKFQKAASKAYDDAISKSKEYADKVVQINDKLEALTQTSEDKIRGMRRKTMTEEQAWNDKRMQAEEKLKKARELSAKGGAADLKEAEALAKQAQDIYTTLQTEVKKTVDGQQQTAKSLDETSRVAISGYQKANTELEKIYTTQKDQATEAMTSWQSVAASIKGELDQLTKERKSNIEITLGNLGEVEKRLNDLSGERGLTLTLNSATGRQTGGPIGMATGGSVSTAFRDMLRGGFFPGYGGGDRRHVIAEDGEYMINKDKVKDNGVENIAAINNGQLNIKELLSLKLKAGNAIRANVGGYINQRLQQIPLMLSGGGTVDEPYMSPSDRALAKVNNRYKKFEDDRNNRGTVAKIVELRFPGGSLQGSESSVEALLSGLEIAGLRA